MGFGGTKFYSLKPNDYPDYVHPFSSYLTENAVSTTRENGSMTVRKSNWLLFCEQHETNKRRKSQFLSSTAVAHTIITAPVKSEFMQFTVRRKYTVPTCSWCRGPGPSH
jgi:hypothetical protein